jgi:hypothetical protein
LEKKLELSKFIPFFPESEWKKSSENFGAARKKKKKSQQSVFSPAYKLGKYKRVSTKVT